MSERGHEHFPARFTPSDAKQLALLTLGLPVATFVPERWWKHACRCLARLTSRPQFAHAKRLEGYLPHALPNLANRTRQEYLRGQEARYLEEYLQVLREWTWRWRPAIQLEGQANLDEALRGGKGAILWVHGFESSDLVVKMALRKHGVPVVHLSRPAHGYSASRFGMRVLNPIRKRVEDRYLGSRVVIEGQSAVGALRTLQRQLAKNAVVSITVSDTTSAPVSVALLGGTLRVSRGPVQLAALSGAPLIPVFTLRGPTGAFVVRLGPAVAGGALPNDAGTALALFAEQLESAVREAPEQWTGWRTGSFSEGGQPRG